MSDKGHPTGGVSQVLSQVSGVVGGAAGANPCAAGGAHARMQQCSRRAPETHAHGGWNKSCVLVRQEVCVHEAGQR